MIKLSIQVLDMMKKKVILVHRAISFGHKEHIHLLSCIYCSGPSPEKIGKYMWRHGKEKDVQIKE